MPNYAVLYGKTLSEGRKPVQTMTEQDFYTLDQVARMLQMSRDTVSKFIANGDLATYRVGRQIRISRQDFNKFMEARKESK